MAPIPEGSLRPVADGVLVRSIWMLRHTQRVLHQNRVPEENPHLREIEESLRQMEAEAERRRLSIPEEPPEAWSP